MTTETRGELDLEAARKSAVDSWDSTIPFRLEHTVLALLAEVERLTALGAAPASTSGFDDAYFLNLASGVLSGRIPMESVNCDGLADDLARIAARPRAAPGEPAQYDKHRDRLTGRWDDERDRRIYEMMDELRESVGLSKREMELRLCYLLRSHGLVEFLNEDDYMQPATPPAEGVERVLAAEILAELARARSKFPGDNVTTLALVEEVGELAKATFEESRERVRKEAVQVATMAMRVVLDGDSTLDGWRATKGLDPLTPASSENER